MVSLLLLRPFLFLPLRRQRLLPPSCPLLDHLPYIYITMNSNHLSSDKLSPAALSRLPPTSHPTHEFSSPGGQFMTPSPTFMQNFPGLNSGGIFFTFHKLFPPPCR